MDQLDYGFHQLQKHNRDGSHATQADRRNHLKLISRQLKELGFRHLKIHSLKTKHVNSLINHWKTQASSTRDKPISTATIKNRVATLRWVAEKINKQNIVPRSNAELGLSSRQHNPENKAWSLKTDQINTMPIQLQYSLRLQQEFGLRREEAAKIHIHQADKSHQLHIQSSWAKGGRERAVPITSPIQRELINEIKTTISHQSLIPSNMSYKQYLNWHTANMAKHEIVNSHGLRHFYAQQRYLSITGQFSPKQGGPSPTTEEEKEIDRMARFTISFELGHSRIGITKVYLG